MSRRVTGVCLAVALVSGCSTAPPPRVAMVHGRVTYKGQPVPGGQVAVKAMGENPQVEFTYALLRADGTYTLTEAPIGPVKVSVDTESLKAPTAVVEGSTFRYVEIPKRYAEFDNSGLTLDVQQGDQEFNIDLVP